MGWQIVTQPNGLFTIFSTIIDDVIAYDCNDEELIEHFAEKAYESAKHSAKLALERHKERGFAHWSWDEMQEQIAEVHGKAFDIEEERRTHGTDNKSTG